jgi:hypothetical protein
MLLVGIEAWWHHLIWVWWVALWVARMSTHWWLTIRHHGIRRCRRWGWRCSHRAAICASALGAWEVAFRTCRERVWLLRAEAILAMGIKATVVSLAD